jgi:hypothetical protein
MYSDWLSKFPETRIVELPLLLATHNSASNSCGDHVPWWKQMCFCIARQQSAYISDQLVMGVRFLDLRLHLLSTPTGAEIHISHSLDTVYTLKTVLAEVSEFLRLHPSEFIIIYLRIDHWYRLDSDRDERAAKVRQVLTDSGAPFADYSPLAEFSQTKVSDVSGKICLMFPDNGTVVPRGSTDIGYIDSLRFYRVLDVWESSTVCDARAKLDNYMGSRSSNPQADILTGVCLDLSVGIVIPPSWTSPSLNRWFVEKLRTDPDWSKAQPHSLGVLMLDFVDEDLVRELFEIFYPIN